MICNIPGVSRNVLVICYTVKTDRAVSFSQISLNSERPNLDFDIWHKDVRAILNKI